MSSTLELSNLFRACSFPQATPEEVSVWNALADGGSASGSVKVGLFGYDISCLASMCASIENRDSGDIAGNFKGYCGLIEARGLDGLAFGSYFKLAEDNLDYYCAGFRNDATKDRTGNTIVCFDEDNNAWTQNFHNFYQVSETFFTTGDFDSNRNSGKTQGLGHFDWFTT